MKCVMIILLSIIRCHFSNEAIQTTTVATTKTSTTRSNSTTTTLTNISSGNSVIANTTGTTGETNDIHNETSPVPMPYFLPLQILPNTSTNIHDNPFVVQNAQPQLPFPKTALSRIVETKYGKIQGLRVTLFPTNSQHPLRNKVVEVYLSVPYAAAPIKSNRFSPTQTPIPWEGIRQVIKPGFVCPQAMPDIRDEAAALKEMPKYYLEHLRRIEPFLRNQSEDCLYLNIFSPVSIDSENSKSDSMSTTLELKPVLVFIHGGKFSWGSGTIVDGTFLASYANILVVTLNYRLGVLGFLNMNPTPNIKPRVANFGLMDQIGALHWLKENVALFGGDPNNVSLMGYEAGAASIHFLMSSPTVVPGLFHRAILVAGSSKAPWAISEDPFSVAISLADSLNCSIKINSTTTPAGPPGLVIPTAGIGTTRTNSSSFSAYLELMTSSFLGAGEGETHLDKRTVSHITDSLLDCFRNKHFSYFTKFLPPKFSIDFGPSVDGVVILPNFWTTMESQNGKRDLRKVYDLMFGMSSAEMLHELRESDLSNGIEGPRRDAILRTLVRNSYKFHRNEILATITNEYIDWERNVQHPISARDSTLAALTDGLTLSPLIAASESTQIRKAYFYVFEHSTKDGPSTFQKSGGASGEELNYFFGFPLVETILPFFPSSSFFLLSNYTNVEMALSETLINYLSNFVHSGNPNEPNKGESIWPISNEKNRFRNLIWESYDRLHQKYLELTAYKLRLRSHYRSHQIGIWQKLIPELERSGAQYASVLHNQMKGGYDPSLYVGRLKLPDEIELAHRAAGDFEEFYFNGSGIRPSPPTTCFSSLSSIYSDMGRGGNGNVGAVAVEERKQQDTGSAAGSLEMSFMSPYATALSITIAVGCSLLILNVLIFALLYYRSDKQRSSSSSRSNNSNATRSSGRESSTDSQQLHNFTSRETPELLNSNSTTATSFHHSQSTDSCRNPDDQYRTFNTTRTTSANDVNFYQSFHPQQQKAGAGTRESLCVIPIENQLPSPTTTTATVHFAQDVSYSFSPSSSSLAESGQNNEQLILSHNKPQVYVPKNAASRQQSFNKATLQGNHHQSNVFQPNEQQQQQSDHVLVNLEGPSHHQHHNPQVQQKQLLHQQQPLEVSTLQSTSGSGVSGDKVQLLQNHSAAVSSTLQRPSSSQSQKPAPPRRTSASNYVTQRQILSVIMTALIFGFL